MRRKFYVYRVPCIPQVGAYHWIGATDNLTRKLAQLKGEGRVTKTAELVKLFRGSLAECHEFMGLPAEVPADDLFLVDLVANRLVRQIERKRDGRSRKGGNATRDAREETTVRDALFEVEDFAAPTIRAVQDDDKVGGADFDQGEALTGATDKGLTNRPFSNAQFEDQHEQEAPRLKGRHVQEGATVGRGKKKAVFMNPGAEFFRREVVARDRALRGPRWLEKQLEFNPNFLEECRAEEQRWEAIEAERDLAKKIGRRALVAKLRRGHPNRLLVTERQYLAIKAARTLEEARAALAIDDGGPCIYDQYSGWRDEAGYLIGPAPTRSPYKQTRSNGYYTPVAPRQPIVERKTTRMPRDADITPEQRDQRARLDKISADIRGMLRQQPRDIITIGHKLIEGFDLVLFGETAAWFKSLGIARTTAMRWMEKTKAQP